MNPIEFAQRLALVYAAPELDYSSLESAYRSLRETMHGEYSMRSHDLRQATRRVGCCGDYVAPGPNFLIGATDKERHDDHAASKRAARAIEALERANSAMDQYDRWVQFKYILAILTGRYDGSTFLGGRQTDEERAVVAEAFLIRREEAPSEWAGV